VGPADARDGEAAGRRGRRHHRRNVSHFLGRDVETTYTVVEHRPPLLLRVEGRSGTFTSLDTILVAAHDGGSVVTYTADFTFTGPARLAAPALGLALGHVADAAAIRMAGCLDGLVAPQTYAG
jgi:hypothetical protein